MFTGLTVHLIKGTRPYDLPPADIYIFKYSCLAGWTNFFETGFFKSAIFDEVQELRHEGTGKYEGAMALSKNAGYCLALSATPIFNYGDEIFNVLDVIKPGCLGNRYDFLREWTGGWKTVREPQALGTYLRENFLMLRRTRAEVGRELPPVNKIVHTVEYDNEEVQKAEHIAKQLAIKATSGSFMERGQASRELDIFVRHNTGVAKAKGVAQYVKILLENKVPIILAGWHRQVYEIWLEELKEYKPVMYTGTESPTQKEEAKRKFIDGETDLFIISLRSGVGLDGLQERCDTVVIGEIDYSPQVHNQLIGRSNRDKKDGTPNNVTAIFLVSDCGSDPLIIDMLGIKSSQSHNIINPLTPVAEQHSDESRLKLLAQKYLDKCHTVK
jgi:SNF2 family DNA or RNA helicase